MEEESWTRNLGQEAPRRHPGGTQDFLPILHTTSRWLHAHQSTSVLGQLKASKGSSKPNEESVKKTFSANAPRKAHVLSRNNERGHVQQASRADKAKTCHMETR